MEKLTSKIKHTVRVGNHLHTNMISKPTTVRQGDHKHRILEMHSKLKDQQLKTILHIYRLLYQNLMGTTNQKSTVDTHTEKKSNPNTTLKIDIRASLVAQWLRICLLMQETRVRALVWEDPTCHGAAGPVSHSC